MENFGKSVRYYDVSLTRYRVQLCFAFLRRESLYSVTRSSTTLTQSSGSSSGGVVFDRGVSFEHGESLVT